MEWQPEDRDAWVVDAEKWITQIKGVLQCKIDLTSEGEISGVHVVARSDREPRHIVRDVEGLLKARLGISVFYKKIGVVQVVESDPVPADEPAPAPRDEAPTAAAPATTPNRVAAEPRETVAVAAPPVANGAVEAAQDAVLLAEEFAPRLQCNGVGIMSNGDHLRAEVDLQAAGLEASGVAEGSNRHGGDLQLVALATLEAVEALVNEPLGLELVELKHERLGRDDVILVAVELVQGRRSDRLYGACEPGANLYQAVVFAVLDALNRRLEMMLFRSAREAES
ncbi:MAG: hypothetical protein R3D98_08875 [Candidatus Krumholzibacteriia bacterium]